MLVKLKIRKIAFLCAGLLGLLASNVGAIFPNPPVIAHPWDSIVFNIAPDDTVLFRQGYNTFVNPSHGAALADPAEAIDTVTAGTADWRYFVMADSLYNTAYYNPIGGSADYMLTDSTSSTFRWHYPSAVSALRPIRKNSTGTSPHVGLYFSEKTKGVDTVTVTEIPNRFKRRPLQEGMVCSGDSVVFRVKSIDRPNVMFDSMSASGVRSMAICTNSFTLPLHSVDTALLSGQTVYHDSISEAAGGRITITYDIEKLGDMGYAPYTYGGTTYTGQRVTLATGVGGNQKKTGWPFTLDGTGTFRFTIRGVSDRVSEKCGVEGLVRRGGGANRFTVQIMNSLDLKTQQLDHIKNRRHRR